LKQSTSKMNTSGLLFLAAVCALLPGALASCPASVGPGEHLRSVTVGGVQREFYVYVPRGLGERVSPGVMMIHGCGSSPEKFEMESQMNARAEAAGYYNIYTKGTDATGGSNPRLGWNAGFSQCNTRGAVNDVDFMRAVTLWSLEQLCIDTSRIFAAGFSNGGSMTFNLTCEMPDVFSGFSFTGATMPASTYPNIPNCGGGLDDKDIKPILGLCGSLDGCSSSIARWFQEYSVLSGCAGRAVEKTLSTTSTCMKHSTCGVNRNHAVEYCMVKNLGHCWSGNDCCDGQCLNQDAANMDFSQYILDFFTDIPRSSTMRNASQMATMLRSQLL